MLLLIYWLASKTGCDVNVIVYLSVVRGHVLIEAFTKHASFIFSDCFILVRAAVHPKPILGTMHTDPYVYSLISDKPVHLHVIDIPNS